MKIFIAGFLTESCDFNPIPTTEEAWLIERPGENSENPNGFLSVFREMTKARGWEVAESICAASFPPGGRTVRSVYENLRSIILGDLRQAMPVDGVLLHLHGAAMAYGYDDCEGDLLEHIRGITGPDIPIGVELDPHCHMTDKMMNNATAMILYKTFYHYEWDVKQRGVELFNLIADTLVGSIKPTMALFDCKMIAVFNDEIEPMKSFVQKIIERENEGDILSISPVHCYSLADTSDVGCKMLVITNDAPELARQTAEKLGMDFHELRGQYAMTIDFDTALDQMQQEAANGAMANKIVEFNDSAGIGFPMDGTELLRAMLERGMSNVAAGLICDPQAVFIAHNAGEGAELTMRIGGKASSLSGIPLDLNVVVKRVYRDIILPVPSRIGEVSCDAAVVSSGETDLLLTSKRINGAGLQPFKALGLEPENKQYLMLKHVAGSDNDDDWFNELTLAAPTSFFDFTQHSYTRITLPKWPWNKDPFLIASNAND